MQNFQKSRFITSYVCFCEPMGINGMFGLGKKVKVNKWEGKKMSRK